MASPRLVAVFGIPQGYFPAVYPFPLSAHLPLRFFFAVLPYFADHLSRVGKVCVESQKVYPVPQREDIGFAVKFKPKFANVFFDNFAAMLQIRLILADQEEIVHIPPVIANMKLFLHQVI